MHISSFIHLLFTSSLIHDLAEDLNETCFRSHNCNEVRKYGKKEAGTGEHLTHFNNKINKHKWKAAAPHGRLPHTKHKLKIQAWSSLVFHCRHSSFNPSEAPPWDSRPVSGAGVVHYQLLHRPRSVPTALGPAPLVTTTYMKWVSSIKDRCALVLSESWEAIKHPDSTLSVSKPPHTSVSDISHPLLWFRLLTHFDSPNETVI